jgi:hypothetical protein
MFCEAGQEKAGKNWLIDLYVFAEECLVLGQLILAGN